MDDGEHSPSRAQHVIDRALIRHRVVLDIRDIKKLRKKIIRGCSFLISKIRCHASCQYNRGKCMLSCIMVDHVNKEGIISPLPVIYCDAKREIFTVLPMGSFEFKRWNGRRLSRC